MSDTCARHTSENPSVDDFWTLSASSELTLGEVLHRARQRIMVVRDALATVDPRAEALRQSLNDG